jgi:hypothetical protein
MHIFSMTCKAEGVLDRLGEPAERLRAIEWFRTHSITKLYIESYRHGRLVPAPRLCVLRDEFRAAGFEVGGCITPTCLSDRNGRDTACCFTDPTAQERLQRIVEHTAGVFDFLILDDFMFTDCTCPDCTALRGGRDWAEMRCRLMLQLGRERVLAPARRANPGVRVILKYPNWYESFRKRGYDVLGETALYDEVWVGTETREPDSPQAGRRPQTMASWIQGWMNDLAGDRCGGGWYDPIDTRPATYLEQARQTILGGARESLLHCYDYLGTDTPGVAIHGKDLAVEHGRADAEAFRREVAGLAELAAWVGEQTPRGVLVPKAPCPPAEGHAEDYLPGFVGMLGIPVLPASRLREAEAAFLGRQALGFDGLVDWIDEAIRRAMPLVVTDGLLDALRADGLSLPAPLAAAMDAAENRPGAAGSPEVIRCTDTLRVLHCPEDLWDLTRLGPADLDRLRGCLSAPFGLAFAAPSRVSLHLFGSGPLGGEVIENFRDDPVEVSIGWTRSASSFAPGSQAGASPTQPKLLLTLSQTGSASLRPDGPSGVVLSLPPRSLAVLEAQASGA